MSLATQKQIDILQSIRDSVLNLLVSDAPSAEDDIKHSHLLVSNASSSSFSNSAYCLIIGFTELRLIERSTTSKNTTILKLEDGQLFKDKQKVDNSFLSDFVFKYNGILRDVSTQKAQLFWAKQETQ